MKELLLQYGYSQEDIELYYNFHKRNMGDFVGELVNDVMQENYDG